MTASTEKPTSEHTTPVLVVGGGPAGLIAALQLANHGTKCILAERNLSTTEWPKMDITNCRSMELFNRLGIAQRLREQGVPEQYSFDVLFSSGLSPGGEVYGRWNLDSVSQYREKIQKQNDGSMPREPYQRCSQAIFEAWLKPWIQKQPLIDSRFGLTFESLEESEEGVTSILVDSVTGERHAIHSKYVIGCDGAGSRVRRNIGIELSGGPTPRALFMVHFKSRDLSVLHRQGRFWHIFFSNGGAIISQDEDDTWTVHHPLENEADSDKIDPNWIVAEALGGSIGPCPCKIDKVLVTSKWRANICLADRYVSEGGRVFLSGDSAHQNIPTGGYGMNTAVGDSFDIGWKIAAVINGTGGKHLLASYETERRPVAYRNIERSGVHSLVHRKVWESTFGTGKTIIEKSDEGKALREKLGQFVTGQDGENRDLGIEMGYRNNYSPVVVPDTEAEAVEEPAWDYRSYTPSTWPGARAPHVFLADGKTSIFDCFGLDYTIVDFTKTGTIASEFVSAADKLNMPLKTVHLPDESHAHKVWEGRDAVLIRPDDHVAWRAPLDSQAKLDPERILKIATGLEASGWTSKTMSNGDAGPQRIDLRKMFSGTVGMNKVEGKDVFKAPPPK